MEERYHKEVFFSSEVELFIKNLLSRLTFYPSHHFFTQSIRRKLPFPTRTALNNADIFEYTITDGKLQKFCVRCPSDTLFHYCYSIAIDGTVLTGWKNKADDIHFTLKKGKYIENEESKTGI